MTKVLNKGLLYVITPQRVNETELRADLASWKRTIRWKEFFHKEDNDPDSDSEDAHEAGPPDMFKRKKTSLPPTPAPLALDSYLKGVESDLLGSIKKSFKRNITPEEVTALNDLKEAQEDGLIRLSAADKGGGIALMSTEVYVEEMMKQHLNSVHEDESGVHQFYEMASMNGVRQLCQDIKSVLEEGVKAKFISKSDMKAMDPPEKVGRLYGLVKVHKPVKEGHTLPPLRPVVSGSGCVTEKISEFIDLCIKDQVKKIPSFIEDSPDILRQIQKENEKGPQDKSAFPVTVDVSGLYTNIPGDGDDGGLQAFEKALNNRSDRSIPTEFLMTLLSLVLGGNYFEFDQKIYKQLIGTAMGTRVTCSYACLFMSWLESTRLLGNWKGVKPHLWHRFIDDVWFVWRGSEEELKDFIKHLNSSHRLIKFTAN